MMVSKWLMTILIWLFGIIAIGILAYDSTRSVSTALIYALAGWMIGLLLVMFFGTPGYLIGWIFVSYWFASKFEDAYKIRLGMLEGDIDGE